MTALLNDLPVHATDVMAAAERLRGAAVETPLLESDALNALVGGRLLIKPESAAANGLLRSAAPVPTRCGAGPTAVVAYSSGNHAQGVALAARLLGAEATIVMPADAPRANSKALEHRGATVVTYDRRRRTTARRSDARSPSAPVPC